MTGDGLFSTTELAKLFSVDRGAVESFVADTGLKPRKTEDHPTGDRKYWHLSQFWPYISEFSGGSSDSELGDIDSKTKDQIKKEIDFEKARKDKRENDIEEGLYAPIQELVQAGAGLMDEAGKILDKIGADAKLICPQIDESEVDELDQKVGVPVKNKLAGLVDKLLETVPNYLEADIPSTKD